MNVWHKNTEDIGQGDTVTVETGNWSTSGNLTYGTFKALKELVRFEFQAGSPSTVLVGTVQAPGGTDADVLTPITSAEVGWVLFRMLAPTWFNTAEPAS